MSWPNDADGDVFRRMESDGFDFTKEHDIDFNVDFDDWPPAKDAVNFLKSKFQNVEVIDPESDESNGYIVFKIHDKFSYELVTSTQTQVTRAMQQYGGWCESWGVMQE